MENITENTVQKKGLKFEMPHTYVIIGIILLLCTLLTFIVPSGEYDRAEDPATGRMVVVPGTYHHVEGASPTLLSTLVAIQRGMVSASNIIFFIFFAYGLVYITLNSGAMDASVGTLLRLMKGKTSMLIPIFMIIFGALGSTIGMFEEVYGLLPIFMGIFLALGYDAIVGAAVIWVGTVSGFAAATTNPFTVGVAQGIAGIPINSGLPYRIVLFVVFMAVTIAYVMIYAHRVKKDPTKSVVYGMDFSHLASKDSGELEKLYLTTRHKLVMLAFVSTIAVTLFGTLKFGWYIDEIAGAFIMGIILVGLLGGNTLSNTMVLFVKSVGIVATGALVVGIARSILVVMQDAMIIDSIVYYCTSILEGTNKYMAAAGMVVVQNLIDFFIPSGSAQAATTMPILVPIGDMLGVSPQISVLALQLGAGFSDMFWPTAVATACGVMGVPLNKWYKFIGMLFLIQFILQIIAMVVAAAINYV